MAFVLDHNPGAYKFHGSFDACCFCPEHHPDREQYASNSNFIMQNLVLNGQHGPLDFGSGVYLSDDADGAREWVSRYKLNGQGPLPIASLNVFDVDAGALHSMSGYVFDVDASSESGRAEAVRWAYGVASSRAGDLSDVANRNRQDLPANFQFQPSYYDWIIAPRSDDHIIRACEDFFSGNITTVGLATAIEDVSLGAQLVLKTANAIRAFAFLDCQEVVTGEYLGVYNRRVSSLTTQYYDFIRQQYSGVVVQNPVEIQDVISSGRV